MNQSTKDFFAIHDTHDDLARMSNEYATMAEVWDNCHRVSWLCWLLDKINQKPESAALRLFACWCVRETPLGDGRKVWDLLKDERSREAVIVAEKFARGQVPEIKLYFALLAGLEAVRAAGRCVAWAGAKAAVRAASSDEVVAAVGAAAWAVPWAVPWATYLDKDWDKSLAAARKFQADRFRTLFPNPFRTP